MSLDRLIQSNAELQYPSVKPELDLNLTRKTLKGIDPAYSFTRNSAATYVGPDGYIKTAAVNQPRFDYDPVTGDYRGLLVEESRTNLMFPSSVGNITLNDGGVSTTIDTTIANPFGTFGDVLRCTHTSFRSGYFRRGQNVTLTSGVTYTFSFFFKNGTVNNPYGNNPFIIGILATTFISSFQSFQTSLNTNIDFGNNWYRQVLTFTPSYTKSYQVNFSQKSNQTPIGTYYLYGFQLEQGSFPTSYIPTSGSTVTRQPDQLVLNKTLNTQGTFFIESNPTTGVPLVADNGSSSLSIGQPINQYTKSVLYYNTNRTLRMASDNSVPNDFIYTNPQDLNRVSLGFNRLSNDNYINGYLKKFSYYSSPLSEDNLRALTGNKKTINRDN